MSRDEDNPEAGEAFFSRWSRRKQKVKAQDAAPAMPPSTPEPTAPAAAETAPTGSTPTAAADETKAKPAATPPRPLTEDDFADVDFSKLDYTSDYGRFTQSGVPEAIRQKALTQLWHSDTVFTQVDPFQDYAGDFTDAATVPKGVLKTAYKVGQGFLTDDEAHAWDRLGKADVTPEIAALPILRPGYRVRRATVADAADLVRLQTEAIRHLAVEAYGAEVAESWASGLTVDMMEARLVEPGCVADVAIDDNTGGIAAMLGRVGTDIKALFVAPGHGRRGLARRLIERTIADIERDVTSGAVTVAASRASQPIFARLGFRDEGARQAQTRGGALMEVFDMTRPIIGADTVTIAAETPDQPEVRAFFAASEAYMGALYPAESNHFVDAAHLAQSNVIFLVARRDGVAIGCGAVVKTANGSGEIKRMWLDPAARGLKLGARLLDTLEATARHDGVHVLQLETGIHQPEAISLYRRAGFVEIAPFGDYQPDPLSLFMEKRMIAPDAAST
jgi:putative acetyltransferase